MYQTRKGNRWIFGMKAHLGVDSKTILGHSIVVTPGNVDYSQVIGDLLHGNETKIWGDSAYAGQTDVLHKVSPNARDYTQKKGSRNRQLTDSERATNRWKSKLRARVEYAFGA